MHQIPGVKVVLYEVMVFFLWICGILFCPKHTDFVLLDTGILIALKQSSARSLRNANTDKLKEAQSFLTNSIILELAFHNTVD